MHTMADLILCKVHERRTNQAEGGEKIYIYKNYVNYYN
jgi:hypothetical protein